MDVATWTKVWNYTALAETHVPQLDIMSTYTSDDPTYYKQLNNAVNAFGLHRTVVGLETVNATTGGVLSSDEIEFRFDKISVAGVDQVALWRSYVPDNFWPIIRKWVYGSQSEYI